jgi:DNA-binding NarL/FixJ family response regulator
MRILLVDDHALFRDALVHVLKGLDAQAAIVHAATAREALAAAGHYENLDLILLDLYLPGSDGCAVLGRFREVAMTVPVVVLSASDKPQDVRRALDAGAAGYIPKTTGSQEMLEALHRVLEGDIYVPAALLAAMGTVEEEATYARPDATDLLTERQLDVLRFLGQGLSNKGIANRLDLTEGTVKLHVSALMRALGARNRTEAVMAAERMGLLAN